MKRVYQKRPMFDLSKLGQIAFILFVIFIAYRILTPPSDETARVTSPNGNKTARLRTIYYYDNQPSYKIYYRETGKQAWHGLYYLPAATNTLPSAAADLAWNETSDRVDLLLNGTSIWHHAFAE